MSTNFSETRESSIRWSLGSFVFWTLIPTFIFMILGILIYEWLETSIFSYFLYYFEPQESVKQSREFFTLPYLLFRTAFDGMIITASVFIAVGAIYYYTIRKNILIIYLGSLYFFLALFNYFDFSIIQTELIKNIYLAPLIDFFWLCRETIFSGLLILFFIIFHLTKRANIKKEKMIFFFTFSLILGGVGSLFYFLIFQGKYLINYQELTLLHHPYEIISIGFTIIGFLLGFQYCRRHISFFVLGLIISLIPKLASEIYVLFSIKQDFLNPFNLSQIFELISYFPIGMGVILDNKTIYWVIEEERKNVIKANRAKDEFIEEIATELEYPIDEIKGYIHFMMQKTEGPLTEEQQKSLSKSHSNCEQISHLIRELADLAQIRTGRFNIQKQLTNLEQLIRGCIEPLNIQAEEKNLKIHADIDPKIVAEIDPDRTKEIFINIIHFILSCTQDGEINVIPTSDSLLMIEVKSQKRDENELKNIPADLEKLDGALVPEIKSHLTLCIGKIIMQQMGGFLTLEIPTSDIYLFKIGPHPNHKTAENEDEILIV